MEKGLISEADLDAALRRILRGRIELGTLDPEEDSPWAYLGASDISSPEHTALARKAAREAMVLLKNNGILPLSKDIKKIAVVGPNADNASVHNGNYNGTPTAENTISILEAIRRAVPNAEIIYEQGCELADPLMTDNKLGELNGGKGMHADFFNNVKFEGAPVASGDYSAVNMRTSGDYRFAEGVNANDFAVRLSGKYVADFTGVMNYAVRGVGAYKLIVNGKTIEEQQEQPNMRMNRRAVIPEKSFPVVAGRTYDIKVEYTKGPEGAAYLMMDLCRRYPAQFAEVAKKASQADVIIMVGGLSAQLEGEEMMVPYEGFSGGDRTRIELPPVQKGLLDALDATGKPVVFVNCTGSAIAFAEVENEYDALLQAWYAGQATGLAVADVLFGDYNPAGRLPVTFYKSTSQLPDFHDYNMEGHTYRYFRGEPLYAFGYGLSYTTFEYGDATLSKASVKAGASVDITIPVKNTGSIDGDEVVQVYVKSLDNPEAPIKSLKGFKRVNIAAGQQASVKITLGEGAFEYYDEKIDELSVKPGKYQILYGPSSRDEDLKAVAFEVV
jgi:beta-glucosidase